MKLNEIKARILKEAQDKCKIAERDYYQGCKDCNNGIYDEWYRYNRDDDGQAYDVGWREENKQVQNEKVMFIMD